MKGDFYKLSKSTNYKLNALRSVSIITSTLIVLTIIFLLTIEHSKLEILSTLVIFLMFFLFSYLYIKFKFATNLALRQSETHFKNLVEIAPIAIIIHQDGKIVYANPQAIQLTDANSYSKLIGRPELDLIPQEYHSSELDRIDRVLSGEIFHSVEKKIVTFSGKIIDVEVTNIRVTHKEAPSVMCLFKDIPEHRKIEKKLMEAESKRLKNAAYHDALTRLPNRYLLSNYIDKMLEQNVDNKFSVLFIDLDNFKTVNDTLGHSQGDLILCTAARRLENCIRENDIIARYGGDEFIIILSDVKKQDSISIAERIISEFELPFSVDGTELLISPSIGISSYPEDGDSVEILLKNADVAMYSAKNHGKNNYKFFTPKLNESHYRKVTLENGLRKAIQNEEFMLYYQPQIDLTTGAIYGLEALIRWKHPNLGMVPPSEFIPIAEETGLINQIGDWVLKAACNQNKSWQELGLRKIPISINVSAHQLQQSNFVEIIKNALAETGLDPNYLIVEFTESVMQDTEKSSKIVDDLKALDVSVALDDFGTGYSSLSLLKNLPIDILKIDSYFMKDIQTNPNTLEIIKLIIDLGYKLNFDIIVEGIETEYQARIMKQNKCKFGQGYFFSKPLPPNEVQCYMQEYNI